MKGCEICKAKQKILNDFKSKKLCNECTEEYRQMFDGIFSNRAKKRIARERNKTFEEVWQIDLGKEDSSKNEAFNAFKRGWESYEEENNLEKIPIPEGMKKLYEDAYEGSKAYWENIRIDEEKLIEDLKKIALDGGLTYNE